MAAFPNKVLTGWRKCESGFIPVDCEVPLRHSRRDSKEMLKKSERNVVSHKVKVVFKPSV